jgi:alkylated DNA repair dioxygenase AlkB
MSLLNNIELSKKRKIEESNESNESSNNDERMNSSREKKKVKVSKYDSSSSNEGVTLTFGDCAENHAGMQMLGTLAERGYTKQELEEIGKVFEGKKVELIELHNVMSSQDGQPLPEAYLLVVKKALKNTVRDGLMDEMRRLAWDKMAKMRGKVVNKHARYNLCFDWFDQEADYESGKGTIINIKNLPILNKLYEKISSFPNSTDLKVEGNYYYNLRECGIGFHGDSERAKVIGVRLGGSYPLYYRWYKDSKSISEPYKIVLDHGDLYVMSEKAVGQDWKKKIIPTLRHAAGAKKYTGL